MFAPSDPEIGRLRVDWVDSLYRRVTQIRCDRKDQTRSLQIQGTDEEDRTKQRLLVN